MNCLLLLMIGFVSPKQGAPVVMGIQQTRFQVRSPDAEFSFPNYRNNGYSQEVDRSSPNDEVLVKVRNSQLASKVPGHHLETLPPSLLPLQQELNRAASGRLADQVFILIQWIRANIDNETTFIVDQSPEAVLERRSGNCVGIANLAIYVLDQMGVGARYVTGLAFKREDSAVMRLEGNVLHRWIEVFYEDAGWVFCDPAGKVNFVEATYLVLGVQDLHPLPSLLEQAVNTRVELLHFSDGFRTVGAMQGMDGRIRIRPNRLTMSP